MPVPDLETEYSALKAGVRSGSYEALAIDTSVFDSKKLKLKSGILSSLEQFKESDIRVIVPDIVKKEIVSHIEKHIDELKNNLLSAIKRFSARIEDLKNYCSIDDEVDKEVQRLIERKSLTTESTKIESIKYFEEFSNRVDLEVLCTGDYVGLEDIVELYFERKSPFSNKKKSEFPDAIALVALEEWSESNGSKTIVISEDEDWEAFCAKSEQLFYLKDLSTAISLFQLQTVDDFCRDISKRIKDGQLKKLEDRIRREIESSLENSEPRVEAESSFFNEIEYSEVTLENYLLNEDKNAKLIFNPLEYEDEILTVEVSADLNISVASYVSFSVYDGVDKDEVVLGGNTFSAQKTINRSFIITLAVNIDDPDTEIELIETEMFLDTPEIFINLGLIEPDFS